MAFLLLGGSGCTVVSANRVFPKLSWYWSAEAKEQRREKAATKSRPAPPGQLTVQELGPGHITLRYDNNPCPQTNGCAPFTLTGISATTNLVNWYELTNWPYSTGAFTVRFTNRPAAEFYRAFSR